MTSIQNISLRILIIIIFIILAFSIFFKDSIGSSNYNGVYIGICSLILFIITPNLKMTFFAIFASCVFMLFSGNIKLSILDGIWLYMIVVSLKITLNKVITTKDLKYLFTLIIAFVICSILVSFDNNCYSDNRYNGLLHSTNISSSVFSLFLVLLWEIIRNYDRKQSKSIFPIILICFLYMAMISKTRTLFFFLPYWIYCAYKIYSKRCVNILIMISFLYLSIYSMLILKEFRLQEDGSSVTRVYLYQNLLTEIINNYIIVPHGSGMANKLTTILTDSDNFPTHNDFLKYLYDWGIIFIILVIYIIRLFKNKSLLNLKVFLVTVCWTTCGLHNFLFMPLSWFLYLLILNQIKFRSQYSKIQYFISL